MSELRPLLKAYISDDGELHIVARNSSWDGKAFFLGYTHVPIFDADGQQIEYEEYARRLKHV